MADNTKAMRKAAFVLCLSIAFVTTIFAREVQIRPRLEPGEDFELEVTRSRTDTANPKANYTSVTPVTVRVVAVGPAAVVIDWIPGATRVTGAIANDPVMQGASKIVGDVKLRISLEPDGTYRKLINQTEVVTKLRDAVYYMMTEMQRGMKPEDAKRADGLLRAVFTPANLVNIATRDPQTYVSMYGAELDLASPVETPVEQANPFGGEPLAATLRVRLDAATDESAQISSSVKYQSDSLTKMTIAMLAQAPGPKPPADELAKFRLNMTDESSYVFDRNFGIFREVTTTRKVSGSGLQRTDKCVIKLTREPKR